MGWVHKKKTLNTWNTRKIKVTKCLSIKTLKTNQADIIRHAWIVWEHHIEGAHTLRMSNHLQPGKRTSKVLFMNGRAKVYQETWVHFKKHLELLLVVDITCSTTLGRSWIVVGLYFSLSPSKHPPWCPFPTMWSSRRVRQFCLGQETAQMVALGAYSVVPWVGIASKVDQPDIVAVVRHHEPEALVGEDHLRRGRLVAVEV